jgi:hypothetical protein
MKKHLRSRAEVGYKIEYQLEKTKILILPDDYILN